MASFLLIAMINYAVVAGAPVKVSTIPLAVRFLPTFSILPAMMKTGLDDSLPQSTSPISSQSISVLINTKEKTPTSGVYKLRKAHGMFWIDELFPMQTGCTAVPILLLLIPSIDYNSLTVAVMVLAVAMVLDGLQLRTLFRRRIMLRDRSSGKRVAMCWEAPWMSSSGLIPMAMQNTLSRAPHHYLYLSMIFYSCLLR